MIETEDDGNLIDSARRRAPQPKRQPSAQRAATTARGCGVDRVPEIIFAIMGIYWEKCRSDNNDPGAQRKRYSGGQSAVILDCAGTPALHLHLWFE